MIIRNAEGVIKIISRKDCKNEKGKPIKSLVNCLASLLVCVVVNIIYSNVYLFNEFIK